MTFIIIAVQVVFAARELFDEFDEDNDGKLSRGEIRKALTKLWERTERSGPEARCAVFVEILCMDRPIDREDSTELLETETKQVMERFDTTGDGQIAFREFLCMMCLPPWRLLLPVKVRKCTPFVMNSLRTPFYQSHHIDPTRLDPSLKTAQDRNPRSPTPVAQNPLYGTIGLGITLGDSENPHRHLEVDEISIDGSVDISKIGQMNDDVISNFIESRERRLQAEFSEVQRPKEAPTEPGALGAE